MKKKTTEKLIPPDLNQCQAEKPNGNSFMTLGGVVGRVRCTNTPTVIVTEKKPPKGYSKCGSMSLCTECWAVAIELLGADKFTVKPIAKKA